MKVETRKEFVYVLYRNIGNKFSKTEGTAWEYLGQFDEKYDIYPYLYSCLPAAEQGNLDNRIKEQKLTTEQAHKAVIDLYKLLFGSEKYVCKLRVLLQEVVEL